MTTPTWAIGNFSADALSTSLATNLPAPVVAGDILLASGAFFGTGARSFTSNGTGTWINIYDDGAARKSTWICLDPQVGTSIVTANSALPGYFTVHIQAIPGMRLSGGTRTVSTLNAQPALTPPDPFLTPSIAPAYPQFVVGYSFQVDVSAAILTAPGAGYNLSTGAGITGGVVRNAAEGDGLACVYGDFPAGAVVASGVWSAILTTLSWSVSIEKAAAAPGGVANNERLGIKLGIGI